MSDQIDWDSIMKSMKAVNQFITCPNCKRVIWQDEDENAVMVEKATFTCTRCSLTYYLKPKLLKNHKSKIQSPHIPEAKIVELIEDGGADIIKVLTALIEGEYIDYSYMIVISELIDKNMKEQALEEQQMLNMQDFDTHDDEDL